MRYETPHPGPSRYMEYLPAMTVDFSRRRSESGSTQWGRTLGRRPGEAHMLVRSPSFASSGEFSFAATSWRQWRGKFPDAHPDDVQRAYRAFLARGQIVIHCYPAR